MASTPQTPTSITVSYQNEHMVSTAQKIAAQLGLELTRSPSKFSTILMVRTNRIELIDATKKSKPFCIDFNNSTLAYRRQHGGGRQEAICRAMGLKHNKCPRIIDATAGLGRDSFILAAQGCTIILFERNPILQILLADGLHRGCSLPETAKICKRMELVSQDILQTTSLLPRADVIYLDPMYPHRKKSSLVKKEMRIIRQLVGDDPDADQLLHFALQTAIPKIVVKRPKNSPYLGTITPSASIKEKNSRFDIYLRP